MYRKKSRGWYKHKDFILIDLACLFMALILAYLIRNGSVRNLFTLGIYRNVMRIYAEGFRSKKSPCDRSVSVSCGIL